MTLSKMRLENLTSPQLVKTLHKFHGTRRFILCPKGFRLQYPSRHTDTVHSLPLEF